MTRIAALLLATLAAGPAFAQDTLPAAPTESAPLLRIAPQAAPDFDDTVIELGADTEMTAAAITMTDVRIFARFDGSAPLSRMDRAEIEAEIAARFGRTDRLQPVQTGVVFAPDLSMVLKPFEREGVLRQDNR